MKSTPVRGVKQDLQPLAYKVWEPARVTACLLHNESASYCPWPPKPRSGEGEGKPSANSASVAGNRPEAEVIYP